MEESEQEDLLEKIVSRHCKENNIARMDFFEYAAKKLGLW